MKVSTHYTTMAAPQQRTRMTTEMKMFQTDPPPGISCWAIDDTTCHLQASVIGTKDTPYENGVFKLEIKIPNKYPFEPPIIKFLTSIYHPNIDDEGRICIDILKMPPQGNWKPSLNLCSVLKSIQLLMCEPNAEDPLRAEVAAEYKNDYSRFKRRAIEWTHKYALIS